jgi:hypothetical protein
MADRHTTDRLDSAADPVAVADRPTPHQVDGGRPVTTLSLSSLSTVYVQVPVEATVNGISDYNPTGDPVLLAFLPPGTNPGVSDWKPGSWQSVAATSGTVFLAQCLIGPGTGGVTLTPGTYRIWVKVTDNPEIPVDDVGILQIT